jgi:tetratricopeptide (TPR) repeat protein
MSAQRVLSEHPGLHHTLARYELTLASEAVDLDRADGHLTAALEQASAAIRLDPDWPQFFATRARVRRRLGDLHGARSDYEAALELILRLPRDLQAKLDQSRGWRADWERELSEAVNAFPVGTPRSEGAA